MSNRIAKKLLPRRHRKKIAILVAVAVIAVAVVIVLVVLRKDQLTGQQAMRDLVARVGRHVMLPSDEEPTLATVKDEAALQDSFLKTNAKKDDQILVYAKAQKVYIYRPSVKKLVAIGPLVVEPSFTEVKNARIKIRNGAANAEQAMGIESVLRDSYAAAVVTAGDVAARSDYPYTIVIDLTDGEKYDFVTNIMNKIGAKRGVLPLGEQPPPDTDILIITGRQ